MRKVKNAVIILLTLVLLAVGSLLPAAVSRFQNNRIANVVQYENVEALQLELEEETPSMTFCEKLQLLSNGVGVEVTDASTKLKEEDIMEATYVALVRYMELFFGKSLDNDFFQYDIAMCYDEMDPTRYFYFWHVQLSLDTSYTDGISVILDDETGMLLAVEMYDPEWAIDETYHRELETAIAATYFGEWGVNPEMAWPRDIEEITPNASGRMGIAGQYMFVDKTYGEIHLEIGVYTTGFYINVI